MPPSFLDKLSASMARNRSLLCIGLDPDPFRFPGHFPSLIDADALVAWGAKVVHETADLACCYKPNFAFYEQFGPEGLEALRRTVALVPEPIPVLLDAKRGDIGSTAAAYARAAFEIWGADAVTLSPYLGLDGVLPFLAYPGKMAFLLAYTSNRSAAAVQEHGPAGQPLFEHIVREACRWAGAGQLGFVVGATRPQALAQVRALPGGDDRWLLAPGVGAQGGDLAAALAAGLDSQGSGLIIPVSRAVLYAPEPRAAALGLRDAIGRSLPAAAPGRGRGQATGQEVAPGAGGLSGDAIALSLALFEAGCIQFGDFTLASGRQSPIYIDLRRLASHPGLLRQAARAYAGLLAPLAYDLLAAVPYGALPIGAAVALAVDKPLIYPRKEVKSHGLARAVEGVFSAGQRAVVIEDLVTSGGSVLQAAESLEVAGLVVTDVAALLDREQGGRENLARAGYRLHAALPLPRLMDALSAAGQIEPEQAAGVRRYLVEG